MVKSTELLMAENSAIHIDMATENLERHKSASFYQIRAVVIIAFQRKQYFT
jgi:hypothetical protein